MRVLVLGGTRFIGRRLVDDLVGRGDEVLVVHRGATEPAEPEGTHLHVDRRDFGSVAGQVRDFAPDAVVDTIALSRADVDAVLPHLPDVHLVTLSSMDVYRIYELMLGADGGPEPVPVDETGEVRRGRYPFRGTGVKGDDYEKLDVEPVVLERGGTVLRLGMIHGPHDPQTREEFVLRRVRAGRKRIPVGGASTLMTRLHVDDAAAAIVAALDHPVEAAGEVFNVGEAASFTVGGWVRQVLDAAGSDAEPVRVPDDKLPDDLAITRDFPQHLLVDSRKAQTWLGWTPEDPAGSIARSVRWHLAHPPAGASTDFGADDAALGSG